MLKKDFGGLFANMLYSTFNPRRTLLDGLRVSLSFKKIKQKKLKNNIISRVTYNTNIWSE